MGNALNIRRITPVSKVAVNLECAYTSAVGYDHRKYLAQFFTPPVIAKFMVNWVLSGSGARSVYDPAFGLGAFFDNAPSDCEFSGNDIDGAVLDFFRTHTKRMPKSLEESDYLLDFGACRENIVCNPPYLRFQKFINRETVFRAFKDRLDVRLSGYTNSASAFLLKSISELKPGGRLAYILPSEFLNCGYGRLIKEWLIRDGHLDSVIKVECERDAFSEVTTSVCIVLYDSAVRKENVAFRNVGKIDELSDVLAKAPTSMVPLCRLSADEKWEGYFVTASERVRPAISYLVPLSEYGRFSRGIATGANSFFVLSKSDIKDKGLSASSCRRCITKSHQLKHLTFNDEDFDLLADADAPVFLFSPEGNLDEAAMRYIRHGEGLGCDKGFITSHRKPWYKTESRDVSPLLLNVFSRAGYKVVRNYSSALTLTNFHCFYPHAVREKYIDWMFLYLHSNIGRRILSLSKRKYGNLLDKFEPNDLNTALVPRMAFFDSLGAEKLSCLMESVKRGEDVHSELDVIFAPLLLNVEASESVGGGQRTYVRKPKVEQLRLAIEKRNRNYQGRATGKTKSSKPATRKAAVKLPKSVKAKYAKHG